MLAVGVNLIIFMYNIFILSLIIYFYIKIINYRKNKIIIMSVIEISTVTDFDALLTNEEEESKLTVVFFWAEFHVPSQRGGQMDNVIIQ